MARILTATGGRVETRARCRTWLTRATASPLRLSWAAGLMRNDPGRGFLGPGAEAVGHYGWGGSCAFADPETRVSGAYVLWQHARAEAEFPCLTD